MRRRIIISRYTALLVSMLVLLACAPTASAYSTTPRQNLVWSNQVYAVDGHQKLRADVYRPKAFGRNHPVVVLIHGGGWWNGSKLGMAHIADTLASNGIVAVSIDYRLSCKVGPTKYSVTFITNVRTETPYCGGTHAQTKADVRAAVDWVRLHISAWGGDRTRVSALGISSGGHLVNELIRAGFNNRAYRMRSTITWSGPAYLAAMVSVSPPAGVVHALNHTIGCTHFACPARWNAYSLTPGFIAHIRRSQLYRLPKMAFSYSTHDPSVGGVDSMLTVNRFHKIGARITGFKTAKPCHGFSCGEKPVTGTRTSIKNASTNFLIANA